MSAVMTAVGSPTNPFTVDGSGTFDGVMLGDLAAPRIEATFVGEELRAWNVAWGRGTGPDRRGELLSRPDQRRVSSRRGGAAGRWHVLARRTTGRRWRGDRRGGHLGVVPDGQHPGGVRARRGLPHRWTGERSAASLWPLQPHVRGRSVDARPPGGLWRTVRLGHGGDSASRGTASGLDGLEIRKGRGDGHRRRLHQVGRLLLIPPWTSATSVWTRWSSSPRCPCSCRAPSKVMRPGPGFLTTRVLRAVPRSSTWPSGRRRSGW